jgi:molybdopterin/thiamine biosynthesis adenylyltransferase
MKKGANVIRSYNLPKNLSSKNTYELLPKNPSLDYYLERTDRNIGWISREEQDIIKNTTIGIAGCGGMGAQLAEKLLRLGVGTIKIADTENFDISNINRQFAATRSTVGKSKAFETARMLRGVSDDFTLKIYPQGICEETIEDFLDGCDVVCDEIEFWAVAARILLHQRARPKNIPIFNCNTVGFGTRLFFFSHKGQTMEQMLKLDYPEAVVLQEKVQSKKATAVEINRVMEAVMTGLVPELPEYCTKESAFKNHEVFYDRLFNQGRASIIATNPPMATGFLADRILLFLIRNSSVKREIVELVDTPGYLYFDAAKMEAKAVRSYVEKIINLKRLDCPEEKNLALNFIEGVAFERHGCKPPPPPQFLFCAYIDQGVMGTIALDFEPFSIQRNWQFDKDKTPFEFDPRLIAQYGRWMARAKKVSAPLLYIATLFALSRQKKYFIAEAKPVVISRLEALGLVGIFSKIEASVAIDQIPIEGRNYYLIDPPSIYMANLSDMFLILLKAIPPLENLQFNFYLDV